MREPLASICIIAFASDALLTSPSYVATRTDQSVVPWTHGKPDLSGIWRAMHLAARDVREHASRKNVPASLSVIVGGEIPYQPWAAAKQTENFAARRSADPETKSYPGVPPITYMPYRFAIVKTPNRGFLYEYVCAMRDMFISGEHFPTPTVRALSAFLHLICKLMAWPPCVCAGVK